MVDVTLPLPGLSPVAEKAIVARFDGGRLSSDGGLLVLRQIERSVMGRLVSSPPSDHLAARIVLPSVVGTRAATSCHQMGAGEPI